MQPGQIVIQLLINPNQLFYFIILFLSGELMQPGQSATYLKTTAARKINTHQFRSLFNSVLFELSPVQVPLQLCTVCTLPSSGPSSTLYCLYSHQFRSLFNSVLFVLCTENCTL